MNSVLLLYLPRAPKKAHESITTRSRPAIKVLVSDFSRGALGWEAGNQTTFPAGL